MRWALFVLMLGLPACAALTSWDGYVPAAEEITDAGPPAKDASTEPTTPADAGAPTDAGETNEPITVVQTTKLSVDGVEPTTDVAFPNPIKPGNTIIVAVGWYDANHDVASVGDSQGNSYQLVTDTLRQHDNRFDTAQKLYVAANVVAPNAGGSDTLHIVWNGNTDSPDIRAIEVAGLDKTAPFVAFVDNSGRSAIPTAGPVSSTAARGLLFAAGMTSESWDTCADGYTTCVITTESGENVLEARVIDQAGAFNITTPIDDNGDWLLQLATFK